ncbi:MAG: glycosyltransferase family 1 protein, partial [Halobacteriota archaeon]|nr:glycosyltransferase family 1 protein [Halobacteriota archaeon]
FVTGIRAYQYPESLAWCINDLISRPDTIKSMGQEGRKRVENIYRWERIADMTIGVYKKL